MASFEQGVLRLPLDLQAAARRRQKHESYDSEMVQKARQKRTEKAVRRVMRHKEGEAENEELQRLLLTRSRAEALTQLVPRASAAKAKAKGKGADTEAKSLKKHALKAVKKKIMVKLYKEKLAKLKATKPEEPKPEELKPEEPKPKKPKPEEPKPEELGD